MITVTIDKRQVQVAEGATILTAARKLGIEIPTMCFMDEFEPAASCMVCVVQVKGAESLTPACATRVADGMQIDTQSEDVRLARKAALELLLSDHVGDCMGPCEVGCPAGMDIPRMTRQIEAGQMAEAIVTIKERIALPAVLGRICPAPCEKVCRRGIYDDAVSICLLKRYAADVDLERGEPYLPACEKSNGKKVAIVGAGPAGLAAAYYLAQKGYGCVVFDEHEAAGGMLRYGVPPEELAADILDKEIGVIQRLGVEFRLGCRVGQDISIEKLASEFDAVFVAVGDRDADAGNVFGLEMDGDRLKIKRPTYQTSSAGVFAGGDVVSKRRLAVRAVADGREAAESIDQYISRLAITGPAKPFNTRIGKLQDGEIERFMAQAADTPRVVPENSKGRFNNDEAKFEAGRCLHCDCRKADNCKLRDYAKEYEARAGKYKSDRRIFEQQAEHADIIYEPGKCIDCGLCIKVAANAGEELGLSFIGRGFDVRVAVPFGRSVAQGLKKAAGQCVRTCPTGALAFKGKNIRL